MLVVVRLRYRRQVARIPDAVRETVLHRIRQLDRAEGAILMRASVIGRHFAVSVLIATTPWPQERVRAALARACDLQLLVVEGFRQDRYAFRHALTRDIIYAEFVSMPTRPLHRRIARALEKALPAGDATLEDLAYHAWAGGDAKRALHYNELAGDSAASAHAHDDARTYYARARSLVDLGTSAYARLTEKLQRFT